MRNTLNTAKNTLSRDVSVLGRSVPVFLILLIALAGTGTAALLTTYGTVDGTANVSQAIAVNGETSPEAGGAATTYSYSATGGDTHIRTDRVQNNGDSDATLAFDTTVNASNADNTNGVHNHLVVTRQEDGQNLSNAADGNYDVDVELTENDVAEGAYALHFEDSGSETPDYASAVYHVSGVKVDNIYTGNGDADLNMQAKLGDDGVNTPDEVFLLLEDGTLLFHNFGQTGTSDWEQYTASESNWAEITEDESIVTGKELADYTGQSVKAVGVGVGSPSEGTGTRRVDAYVDDINVAGNDIEDIAQNSFTADIRGDASLDFATVTSFDTAIFPDTYTVSTDVGPA